MVGGVPTVCFLPHHTVEGNIRNGGKCAHCMLSAPSHCGREHP